MKKYQTLEIEITTYLNIDVLSGNGSSWETPDQPLFGD